MESIKERIVWKLVRERDGLQKQSKKILWLEFNDEGRCKEKFDEIAVGRSLLMSPFNDFYTWQTNSNRDSRAERGLY